MDGWVDTGGGRHLEDELHKREQLVVVQADDMRAVERHVCDRPCFLMAWNDLCLVQVLLGRERRRERPRYPSVLDADEEEDLGGQLQAR